MDTAAVAAASPASASVRAPEPLKPTDLRLDLFTRLISQSGPAAAAGAAAITPDVGGSPPEGKTGPIEEANEDGNGGLLACILMQCLQGPAPAPTSTPAARDSTSAAARAATAPADGAPILPPGMSEPQGQPAVPAPAEQADAAAPSPALPAASQALVETDAGVPQEAPAPSLAATAAAAVDVSRAVAAARMLAPASPDWPDSLAEQVTWLVDTTQSDAPQEARIELHPAEWGSLQIRVKLGADGVAQVAFSVETPQARHAIEGSLDRLRELMAPQGLAALQVDLRQSSQQGSQARHRGGRAAPPAVEAAASPGAPAGTRPATGRPLRLIDHFA